MNTKHYIAVLGLGALVSLSACETENDPRPTQTPSNMRTTDTTQTDTTRQGATRQGTEPDNTAVNERDRSGDTQTPMDQSQSSEDVDITANIRRAIMNDDNMSMNAQNSKIITDDSGAVTLRGVVNTQAEKESIEAKANAVAGVTRVDNQLEVKAD